MKNIFYIYQDGCNIYEILTFQDFWSNIFSLLYSVLWRQWVLRHGIKLGKYHSLLYSISFLIWLDFWLDMKVIQQSFIRNDAKIVFIYLIEETHPTISVIVSWQFLLTDFLRSMSYWPFLPKLHFLVAIPWNQELVTSANVSLQVNEYDLITNLYISSKYDNAFIWWYSTSSIKF